MRSRLPFTIIVLLALPMVTSSCTLRNGSSPSASVRHSVQPAPDFAGRWRRVITGRQMADALGQRRDYVLLQLTPAGTWTGTVDGAEVKGHVARVDGDEIVLEGAYVDGGPLAGAQAPVRYVLYRDNGELMGTARNYFRGHSVYGWMKLARTQPDGAR